MTRDRERAFLQDIEDMEEGMSRTAERSDIWQDRVVYALCRSVWHIIKYIILTDRKEQK